MRVDLCVLIMCMPTTLHLLGRATGGGGAIGGDGCDLLGHVGAELGVVPRLEVAWEGVPLAKLYRCPLVVCSLFGSRQLREVLPGNVDLHAARNLDRPRMLLDDLDT